MTTKSETTSSQYMKFIRFLRLFPSMESFRMKHRSLLSAEFVAAAYNSYDVRLYCLHERYVNHAMHIIRTKYKVWSQYQIWPKKKKTRLNAVQAIQSPSNDNASAHATDRPPLVETMYGKCRNSSLLLRAKEMQANMKWNKWRKKIVNKIRIHIS